MMSEPEMTPEEREEWLHEGCAHPYCLWFPEDWAELDRLAEEASQASPEGRKLIDPSKYRIASITHMGPHPHPADECPSKFPECQEA